MKTIKNMTLIISCIIILMTSATLTVSAQEAAKNMEIKIKTSAVCNMCKERIASGLAYEKGVSYVSLDLESKMVSIRYNPEKTSPDQLRLAISNLGYDADEVKANEKKYEKLPACCKKDAAPH